MCGVDFYREKFVYAEESKELLAELKQMIEERYEVAPDRPEEWKKLHLDVLNVYKDTLKLLGY
jgi:hypothetical protein